MAPQKLQLCFGPLQLSREAVLPTVRAFKINIAPQEMAHLFQRGSCPEAISRLKRQAPENMLGILITSNLGSPLTLRGELRQQLQQSDREGNWILPEARGFTYSDDPCSSQHIAYMPPGNGLIQAPAEIF